MLWAVAVVISAWTVDFEQSKIFREKFNFFDEGVAQAFGALDSAIRVKLVAALFAQRMTAEDEQFWGVRRMVKLALTITAIHFNFIFKIHYIN